MRPSLYVLSYLSTCKNDLLFTRWPGISKARMLCRPHWISSFPVAQNLPHLHNLTQPQRILYKLRESWTTPENLGQPQRILDITPENLGQPLLILDHLWESWLDNLKEYWTTSKNFCKTTSENIGKPQRILDNLKESWTPSKNLGQPLAALNDNGQP